MVLRLEPIVIFVDKDSLGSSRAPHEQTALVRLGEVLIMPGVVRSQIAVGRHRQLRLEDVQVASIIKLEIVYVDEHADLHTMTVRITACNLISIKSELELLFFLIK